MDNIDYYQCDFVMNATYPKVDVLFYLPDCFLMFNNFSFTNTSQSQILSFNDTAGKDGQFMYGGLMDKCRIVDADEERIEYKLLYIMAYEFRILHIQHFNGQRSAISSEAFMSCFCETPKFLIALEVHKYQLTEV